MKPFLGIDLTNDKKNEKFNGEELIVAKPSIAMTRAFETNFEKADEAISRSKLPLAVRIAQWVCGAMGVLVVIGILGALGGEDGVSLAEAYQNASWLFWLGGGCLAAWLVLKLTSMKKAKTVLESEETSHVASNLEGISEGIFTELAVPDGAQEVDILSFFYKNKDNKIKICQRGLQLVPYFNPVFRAYADSENLYLVNLEEKYAIPRSALQSIRTINKSIGMASWNKEEAPNKGRYKPYKLSTDNYDCVHCKPYHILDFTHGGERWGIYFPCYELPVFEALTGLTPQ